MHAQCENITSIEWKKKQLNDTILFFFCTFEHHFTHLCFNMEIKNFQKSDLTQKAICHLSFNWTGILDLNSESSF